ncbi:3-keto-5-aminohexanoate cleavage protein [Rhizobium sp. L1K21]|uniref:3-keto-5-aminohexanoate cleavage protein n=1 Tax=Rhizobium sp. L1K21 TaxID=2954933 RepID=UPI00211B4C00|nr:3-keto-5-aminohexanoate cleavage protein [Rhizobium sp. L1K21]
MKNVIVTCAVTGSLHTPSMSPHLPITPSEIAAESVAAAEAGASIIHLHARNPEDGRPTPSPDVFFEFLPRIKQQTDAILNMSTGGAPGMSMGERLAAAERASPEMASLNMGSLNVGLYPAVKRIKTFEYEWEKQYLEGSRGNIFANTFEMIGEILERLGKGHGTRFEFECYELGHLYNLAHVMDEGLYDGPVFIQFVLGVLGGTAAELDNLLLMVRTAQRLFGNDVEFSVLAAGRNQMPMATHNALLGGNVRVGLEDNLFISRGELATSNAQQVEKIVRILTELGYGIATPNEARARLELKGASQVAF